MNPAKTVLSSSVDAEELSTPHLLHKQQSEPQKVETEKRTFGQNLADKMATKVGSWAFINVQSALLAGWIGLNVMPGVPHWDESPFILLNLMFSFASAYTAPIVLMSQNRQSEIDRKKAEIGHQVNLKSEYGIELLHEKIDSLQAQQLKELTQIIQKQQRSLDEIKASLVITRNKKESLQESVVLILDEKNNSRPNNFSVNKQPLYNLAEPIGDNSKVIDKHIRR